MNLPFRDKEARRRYERKWKRKEREKIRLEAIEMLGGKCVQCGETDPVVLEIDHIKPLNGKRNPMEGGVHLARKIVRGLVPLSDYQLLCSNDHTRKTYKERISYNGYIQD